MAREWFRCEVFPTGVPFLSMTASLLQRPVHTRTVLHTSTIHLARQECNQRLSQRAAPSTTPRPVGPTTCAISVITHRRRAPTHTHTHTMQRRVGQRASQPAATFMRSRLGCLRLHSIHTNHCHTLHHPPRTTARRACMCGPHSQKVGPICTAQASSGRRRSPSAPGRRPQPPRTYTHACLTCSEASDSRYGVQRKSAVSHVNGR